MCQNYSKSPGHKCLECWLSKQWILCLFIKEAMYTNKNVQQPRRGLSSPTVASVVLVCSSHHAQQCSFYVRWGEQCFIWRSSGEGGFLWRPLLCLVVFCCQTAASDPTEFLKFINHPYLPRQEVLLFSLVKTAIFNSCPQTQTVGTTLTLSRAPYWISNGTNIDDPHFSPNIVFDLLPDLTPTNRRRF